MTIKTLTGTYSGGYTLSRAYSGLHIQSSAAVGGAGVGAAAPSVIINRGVVASGPRTSGGGYAGINVAGGEVTNYGSVTGGPLNGAGILMQSGAIVNYGYINGGAGGGGGLGVGIHSGTIINSGGTIAGGSGPKAANSGIIGYGSVYVDNSGLIQGGSSTGSRGGIGVVFVGFANVNNTGRIYGGAGAGSSLAGAGAYFDVGGTLTNSGVIGGGSNPGATLAPFEKLGGVAMAKTGLVINTGTISAGSAGRYGVNMFQGGTVINGGPGQSTATITGYVGVQLSAFGGAVTNYGVIDGTGGHSVVFTFPSTLVAEAGSSFIGAVDGGGSSTLEIAGGAGSAKIDFGADTLSGAVSATFGGFTSIEVEAGADWTLELASPVGQISGLGGGGQIAGSPATNFSGFDAYVIDPAGGWTVSGANTLSAGQTLSVAGAMTLAGSATITNASAITNTGVIKDKVGGAVIFGGLANAGKVKDVGGQLTVDGPVTGAGSVKINGGTVTFGSSFDQNVAFNGTAGDLVLAQSQSYAGQITGFSLTGGTSLDLEDIGFVDANEASFVGTASSGVLTVSDGTHTANITLIGDYVNSTFVASSDGAGGTIIIDPTRAASTQHFSAAMAVLGRDPSSPPRSGGYQRPVMAAALVAAGGHASF